MAIFEEVEASEEEAVEEFEPLPHEEPDVVWDEEGHWDLAHDRLEALLESLFTDLEDGEDVEAFEEVRDTLGWSKGEVIWEGMDFDQLFSDPSEFHEFELLSRRDQRAFLRERLKTQQASGAAEAGDGEIALETDHRAGGRRKHPKHLDAGQHGRPEGSGSLVSYETETEHRPEDLDIGMAPARKKRHRRA